MTILILTLLAFAAVAALVHPFWTARHGGGRLGDPARDLEDGVRRARDRVYEEIRVLQQERFLNNVAEDAYRAQLQSARVRAAELIREQRRARETADAIARGVDAELLETTERPATELATDKESEA